MLRWFEEHRIPIDYIAGTSIGALVSAAYASGLSPDEVQALVVDADWDLMLLADSPFAYKTFRRKEDARAFPGQLDFGLKGGLRVPSAINSGQQVELLLDRIALPYFALDSFDALPTPFRCVATDIRKAESIVLSSGSLSDAVRASMAIPGVFRPVILDGRLLVDGGALNNVPADVAKAMGAAVVIAVNVSSSTDEPSPPTTPFSVLDQTIDAMMTSRTREALKSADVVIVPDLDELSGSDWRHTTDLVTQGYKAAAARADELLKYQLDEVSYARWMRARQARRRTTVPTINRVRLEGVAAVESTALRDRLEARHVGKPLDRELLEDSVLLISGTDRYDLVKYTIETSADGFELVVRVTPKSHGPPFLMAALDLQNIDANTFAVNARARVTWLDSLLPSSEIRVDVGVGSEQTAAAELYKWFGRSRFFVAPRTSLTRRGIFGYEDGELIAEYELRRAAIGLDVGLAPGLRHEVRLGFDAAAMRTKLRIGGSTSDEISGADRAFSLRWTFDGQDSAVVPSRGLRLRTDFRYFLETPDFSTSLGRVVPGPRDVPQAEASGAWFTSLGDRHRLFVSAGGGTSFGHNAGFKQFRLGGPLRLGALNIDEIQDDRYVVCLVGVLRHWFRLPNALGTSAYVGTWFEQGTAFDRWRDAEYHGSASVGLLLETLIGPASAAYSQSVNGGGRFYVSIGSFLK